MGIFQKEDDFHWKQKVCWFLGFEVR